MTTTTPPSTTPRPGTGAETGQPKRRTLFDRAEVRERRRPEPVAEPTDAPPRSKKARASLLAAVLTVLLIAGCLVSAMIGQLYIPPLEVLGFLLNQVGIDWLPGPSHEFGAAALAEVRSPRLVLTVLVGAALAVAGALMQGIFGNPLAEPGSVGVSAGAAVGASFSIL